MAIEAWRGLCFSIVLRVELLLPGLMDCAFARMVVKDFCFPTFKNESESAIFSVEIIYRFFAERIHRPYILLEEFDV